jgi:CheY-like chemotaxis protein/HPt (histidine-containing phosphotransfer) domain-containing protein
LRPLRILLVEDSLVNQKLAQAMLQPHGHTIVVASKGKDAIQKWASERFDLILMDVQMPEMDGFEATRNIREQEQPSGRRIPILAMTAHALKGDRERCLEAGMDAYVSKPVRARELYAAIERLLAGDASLHIPPAAASVAPEDLTKAKSGQEPSPDAAPVEEVVPSPSVAGNGRDKESDGRRPEDVLDWEGALGQSGVNEQALSNLAMFFVEEYPKMMGQIHDALSAGCAADLRRAAHTLKGSAAVFGGRNTAAVAQQVETFAKEGNLDAARTATATLDAEAEYFLAALTPHAKRS